LNTPQTIQLLADARINEAESLYAHGHYDLAFYVSGYAIELYLKARICQVLNIPDFFDFGNRAKFENEDNITKPYKVHNFTQLLILSGLHPEHDTMLGDHNFRNDWTILKNWNENLRYSSGKIAQDTRDFIDSAKNYIVWIKQFL
jgi:hypothetical protein